MKSLRKYLDRIKPQFEPGGRLHAFQSVFDGFETFLFTPTTTSRSGVSIHDSLDSKRVMISVLAAYGIRISRSAAPPFSVIHRRTRH